MTAIPLPPGLMLVHGNRPEALRDLLVTWVRRHPLAPLETEVILAQSNGIAQWLKLALAADPVREDGKSSRDMNAVDLIRDEDKSDSDRHLANPLRDGGTSERARGLDEGADEAEATLEGGLGIAAALEISLPSRFLWRVYRAVLGGEAVPETSPFDKSRLVWRLMRLGRAPRRPLRPVSGLPRRLAGGLGRRGGRAHRCPRQARSPASGTALASLPVARPAGGSGGGSATGRDAGTACGPRHPNRSDPLSPTLPRQGGGSQRISRLCYPCQPG